MADVNQTPSRAKVTAWLIQLIDSKLQVTQKCGDGRPEAPPNKPLIYPYHVVFSIPGGSMSGPPLGQSSGDAVFPYQVDSVGLNRAQAEMAADQIREWIVGRTPAGVFVVYAPDPEGLRISDRIVDGTPGAPLQEGQPPKEVFTVSDTFGLYVTVE